MGKCPSCSWASGKCAGQNCIYKAVKVLANVDTSFDSRRSNSVHDFRSTNEYSSLSP